jgi:hypothetical protein
MTFAWHHPKSNYWKNMNEARAKTKLQAASDKQQATEATSSKLQAQPEVASDKHQAPSEESHKLQASSDKQQAS